MIISLQFINTFSIHSYCAAAYDDELVAAYARDKRAYAIWQTMLAGYFLGTVGITT